MVKTAVVVVLAFFCLPVAGAAAAGAQRVLTNVYAGPVGPAAESSSVGTPGGVCTAMTDDQDPGDRWLHVDEVWPIPARAGAHSDQCIGFSVTPRSLDPLDPDLQVGAPGDDVQTVTFDLPEGFQAAPGTLPTCTVSQFRIDPDGTVPTPPTQSFLVSEAPNACPSDSQVGISRSNVWLNGSTLNDEDLRSPVYNLTPGPGEVARLGLEINVLPGGMYPTRIVIKVGIAPGSENRLRATASLPRSAVRMARTPITTDEPDRYIIVPRGDNVPDELLVAGTGILMWGNQTEHPDLAAPFFAQQGTKCGVDLSTTATAVTYQGVVSKMTSTPYRVTGCADLPFAAELSLSDVAREAGVPTPLTVNLSVPQPSAPLPSLVDDVTVTLPPGFEVGAQVASGSAGLPLCSPAQFGQESGNLTACPAGARVGSAKIVSPLIQSPFVGSIYLGPQDAVGELPRLYVDVALPNDTTPGATHVRLQGRTTVSPSGQITASFPNNPQLRFSNLELKFNGGPNALFVTPRTCGLATGSGSIVPSNGAAAVAITPSIMIDRACDAVPFAPSVAFGATDNRAGVFSSTQVTIERADRSAWLDAMNVSLPSGFLADLNVPSECSSADAAAATCPDSSRIATVHALAGVGPQPLALRGSMYLTGPEPGVVAGVAIVVRAKIGDIDLGNVVVPGKLVLRPTDAGIDFSADLPTRFNGLALNLRKVVVDLDRQNFALNPSACGPLGYSSVSTGDGGEIASTSSTVAYTGCSALSFAPKITAKLTGDIKPLGHPGMFVELNKSAGDSNLKAATVLLPEGVAADLANVQVSCSRADFDAVNCPAHTRIGSTTAEVSITKEVIRGDVFLVTVPGETLPGLGLNYTGRFAQRVMSIVKIDPLGRLSIRFPAIPDLPLRRMTVDVTGGAKGPLQLGKEDCANGTRWDAEFTGQGGQQSKDQIGLRCAARSTIKLSDRGGFTLRNFDFGGRNLKSAKVTLPSGWSINKKRAKSKKNFARLTGGTATPKYSKRSISLSVKAPKGSKVSKASTLRMKVIGSAISKKKSKSKKAKTVEVKVRFVFTDGAIQNQTIKIKAR